MNSKTKIIVIHSKELIIGLCLSILIIAIIIMLTITIGKSKDIRPTSSTPYTPGVYTASITLNGNPVDIQVSVDSTNIRSISLNNSNDYIQTMYPMLENTLEELASQICENNTTSNIQLDENNQYTSIILIDAINSALKKASN